MPKKAGPKTPAGEAGFFHFREQELTTHSKDFRSRNEDQRLATIFEQDAPTALP